LGNTVTTLNNMTLANATVSSGNATVTTLTAPTHNSASSLTFQTNGTTTAMTIDTSQNVGIGTTSPSQKLHVSGGNARIDRISNTTSLILGGSPSDNWEGDILFVTSNNQINWRVASNRVVSGALTFTPSTAVGGSTFTTPAVTIDASSNLLVGSTNASLTVGEGFKVFYNSGTNPYVGAVMSSSTNAQQNYYLYSTGASAYRFYVGMAGTVYATNTTITGISDERLKENIRDLDDGLTSVMALKPRKFDWKEGKGANTKNARGFIAQEFETVFPDMIEQWKDPAPEGEEPYKAVNANLIPTLVKAIQEQQALITAQAETINALTARIVALESK